jgi:hypothetical protein
MVSRRKPNVDSYTGRNLILLGFLLFSILILDVGFSLAATVGEEFTSDQILEKGSVVSLSQDNPKKVELTTVSNSEYLIGVVNESESNVVTYAKNSGEVKVSVSLAGETEVFVSDANGEIKKGEFIGASWLEGVGMKSITNDKQKLLGVAVEDFSLSDSSNYGVIDTPNGPKDINIDTVTVRLFDKEGSEELTKVGGLEGFLSSLAGKEVSFLKVMAGSLIFLMSVVVAGFFASSSIRGSFISIGRNPMASATIYRSLLHVTMVSVIVIVIGTALSYVVLVV